VIQGTVNTQNEPVIFLTIRGFQGQELNTEAVIDTGFSGHLSLTPEQRDFLKLLPSEVADSTLADGTIKTVLLYTVIVVWDGIERLALAVADDVTPLVGMALLEGHRLTIDAISGGNVEISRL
jgi:clan AA aspartic protease